jgi:putative DNA primase/helicase
MSDTLDRAAARAGLTVLDTEDQIAAGRDVARRIDRTLGKAKEDRGRVAEILSDLYVDGDTVRGLAYLLHHDAAAARRYRARWRAIPGGYHGTGELWRIVEAALVSPSTSTPSTPSTRTPKGYVVPDRVLLSDDATLLDGARVALGPVYVVGRYRDVDSGKRSIGIAWPSEGTSKLDEAILDREVALDPRGLGILAGQGAPVGVHNARAVAEVLDLSEHANRGRLPLQRVARRLGWFRREDGELDGLLAGETWIGDGPAVTVRADDGARQVIEGIGKRGTLGGWLAAIDAGAESPSVWLAVYASIASALLVPLEVPQNYVLDWSGETSRGKTTVLRVGASVWGVPSEAGLLQSWSLTAARAEGVAGLLSCLPLCLDDTKQARTRDQVSSLLYSHAYGQGRGRARPDGLRVSATWRSILLSTGEQPATSYSRDAGARARTISLVGPPLDTAVAAETLTLGVLDHHGHVGPLTVREYLDHPEHYRERYRLLRTYYADRLTKAGPVARRLSWFLALLHVARELLEVVTETSIPALCDDPLHYAVEAVTATALDADQPASALREIYGWAVGRPTAWWERHALDREGAPVEPYGGWRGRWKVDGSLDVIPSLLDEELARRGYDGGVVARWKERGWLHGGTSRRTIPVRVDSSQVRCVRIKAEILRRVCIDGDDGC